MALELQTNLGTFPVHPFDDSSGWATSLLQPRVVWNGQELAAPAGAPSKPWVAIVAGAAVVGLVALAIYGGARLLR